MPVRTLLLCGALCLARSPVFAQARFPSDDSIRSMVRRTVDIRGDIGVVIGLLEADGTRRVITVSEQPYDGRTLFEIGSITKVFTGILLGYAVELGEARLAQPVAELLPDSVAVPSRKGHQITLHSLATHTSGLPRMPDNFRPADWQNPYADYTVAQMYEFLRGHRLQRDIGRDPLYSNLGAALLGHALALRAGVTWEELVRTRVLTPLGLANTMIVVPDSLAGRFAPGHDAGGNRVRSWDLTTFAAAGALRSGADDMLAFLAASIAASDATVLGRAMIRARTSQPIGFATGGLHWGINTNPFGSTLIGHGGGTGGYSTWAGFDPAARRGVVVLSNVTGAPGVYRLGPHLLEPRLPLSTAAIARGFTALACALAALFVAGIAVAWRRSGASRRRVIVVTLLAAIGTSGWLAATQTLARFGLLRFDARPPTMPLLFVAMTLLVATLGRSRVGARLAATIPLALLVGVHAFRLPLELLMHRAYEAGMMPLQMSYSGLNFDIATGIGAIIVALLVALRRADLRVVQFWNLLGSILLLNIIVISLLSTPGPLRVFRSSPPNTWITTPPYVWLPTVMVAFALLGHIVLFRRLSMEATTSSRAPAVSPAAETIRV